MENLVQVRPPGGDRLIIALRAQTPRDRVSFTSFSDVPLDLGHGPVIESFEQITPRRHYWPNSHRQLRSCPEDGPTELIHLSSVHSPIKGFAGVSAGQPQLDVVHFVDR